MRPLYALLFVLFALPFGCSDDPHIGAETLAPPSIQPPSGTYPLGQGVTLTHPDSGVALYYTINGSDPGPDAFLYTQPVALGRDTTFKAIAVDATRRSEIVEAVYVLDTGIVDNGLMVTFLKPDTWSTPVNLYYWDTTPGAPNNPVQWPGVPMLDAGDGWFSYLIEGVTAANLVFNDGTQQTADLSRDRRGWYADGVWTDEKPGTTPDCSPACGAHALCSNHVCLCEAGFQGDPLLGCTSASVECTPICGANAFCDNGVCACNSGFEGDAVQGCTPASGCTPSCGSHAACLADVCQCDAGYSGDPLTACTLAAVECTGTCGANAECMPAGLSLLEGPSICRCRHGFRGDPVAGCVPVTLEPLGDFREETIYFLLTARFYDGDPSNNFYNRDRYEAGDPQWRGDFKGLIEKLDYIKDLGFTAIWITPPVENRSGLDYHGYHAYDWNRIDPRLESVDVTYQDLIDAAHAKGLKIIQDVVVNHSSQYGIRGETFIDHMPIKYYVEQGSQQGDIDLGPYQGNLGSYTCQNREDNDNPLAPAWFLARQTRDPAGEEPLVDPLTGTTVPLPGYNPNRFFGLDAMTLDPEWYHLNGFMAGGDWENQVALQSKHMAGDTIDLATERQNVQDYLNNAIYGYLDMGVDAIRVDTVKHVERGNLLDDFVNRWKAHRPGLFVFGENLVKGIGWQNPPAEIRPYYYTWNADGSPSGFSVLDFSLMSVFRDSIANGNYDKIAGEVLNQGFYSDPTQLVTFFQNHDIGPDNDWKFRFNHEQYKAAAVYNLLWTIRGIPCLYYGEEIEFMKGATQDIDGNDMKVSDTGRAYFGDHLTAASLADTQAHPLYQHLKRLNQIRQAVPALQKGQMSTVNGGGNNLSFTRDYNGESFVAVGLTIGSGQHFDLGVPNGTYVDAVTGRSVSVTGGTLSFDVQANSAGIYVKDGPGKIGVDGVYLR